MKVIIEKIFNLFFSFSEKLRFLLVGGFNTTCSYLIYVFLLLVFDDNSLYLICFSISYCISIVISFITMKYFVFRKTSNKIMSQFFKTFLSYVITYTINFYLLDFFVSILLISPYISQLISLAIVVVITYYIHKYYSFG